MEKRNSKMFFVLCCLVMVVFLFSACTNESNPVHLDIPQEFWGSYSNDVEDIVITPTSIISNSKDIIEALVEQLPSGAAITDFTQNSISRGNYTFTITITYQGVSVLETFRATLSGDTLTLQIAAYPSTMDPKTYTYTKVK